MEPLVIYLDRSKAAPFNLEVELGSVEHEGAEDDVSSLFALIVPRMDRCGRLCVTSHSAKSLYSVFQFIHPIATAPLRSIPIDCLGRVHSNFVDPQYIFIGGAVHLR